MNQFSITQKFSVVIFSYAFHQEFDCSTFVGNTDYNCNTFLLFEYGSFTKVHFIVSKQHGIISKQEI